MNKMMSAVLAALVLSACGLGVGERAAEAPAQASGAVAAAAPQVQVPPASDAQKIAFEYTPAAEKQTVYFDAAGESVAQAASGGFYREIIGQTGDGRLVAQDFYQDIAKPQTAPFILKQGADIKDFSDQTMDSRGIWFRPDGSLYQIQDYLGGRAQGAATFYENDLPVMQLGADMKSALYFYADGRLMGQLQTDGVMDGAAVRAEVTLFRPDGSKMMHMVHQNQQLVSIKAWDGTGKETDGQESRAEAEPLLARISHISAAYENTAGFVMGTPVAASQVQ